VDPRIILLGTDEDEDETLSLRLAIMNNNFFVFLLFWNNFGYLYNDTHMMTVTRFILHQQRFEMLEELLKSDTTYKIFKNSPKSSRLAFIEIINEKGNESAR
jgi:hypothetical protein